MVPIALMLNLPTNLVPNGAPPVVLKVFRMSRCFWINSARASAPRSNTALSTALTPLALIDTTT